MVLHLLRPLPEMRRRLVQIGVGKIRVKQPAHVGNCSFMWIHVAKFPDHPRSITFIADPAAEAGLPQGCSEVWLQKVVRRRHHV